MAWHSGLSLSQTIYTLRYVHHLGSITSHNFKVDTTTWLAVSHIRSPTSERPQELVDLVLRAMVFGLLKSCDLVCREMYRDHLYDVSVISERDNIVSIIFESRERTGMARNRAYHSASTFRLIKCCNFWTMHYPG